MLSVHTAKLFSRSEAPSSPSIISAAEDIQATSMKLKWTPPVDDGGSPITAYRVVILQDKNVTDPAIRELLIEGLSKNNNYTVKVYARNYVFEGDALPETFSFEGKSSCCIRFCVRKNEWCSW